MFPFLLTNWSPAEAVSAMPSNGTSKWNLEKFISAPCSSRSCQPWTVISSRMTEFPKYSMTWPQLAGIFTFRTSMIAGDMGAKNKNLNLCNNHCNNEQAASCTFLPCSYFPTESWNCYTTSHHINSPAIKFIVVLFIFILWKYVNLLLLSLHISWVFVDRSGKCCFLLTC